MADFQGGFNNIQLFYIYRFLALLVQLEKEYNSISDQFLVRIQNITDSYVDSKGDIKQSSLAAIQTDLDVVVIWFSSAYAEWLDKNIVKGVDMAILGQDTAVQYFIKSFIAEYGTHFGTVRDLQNKLLLRSSYGNGLNEIIRKNVWNQRWIDGLKLSDRIWANDKTLRTNLHSMIEQCINQGRSAVEFSRAVEQYLNQPGPTWTTAIKPSVTGRGSIKYNALRLARTEINNAYRKAQDFLAVNSLIVKGIKWNLSRSHPKKDICDTWATQDLYGLGPGVYPAGQLPPGHPNCLCFLTDVLKKGNALIEALNPTYSKAA